LRQGFNPLYYRANRVDGALYAAMEFTGEAIDNRPMDGRFTMANMAIEAAVKQGIFMSTRKH